MLLPGMKEWRLFCSGCWALVAWLSIDAVLMVRLCCWGAACGWDEGRGSWPAPMVGGRGPGVAGEPTGESTLVPGALPGGWEWPVWIGGGCTANCPDAPGDERPAAGPPWLMAGGCPGGFRTLLSVS